MIEIITGGRTVGKTECLLRHSAAQNTPILCTNAEREAHLLEMADKLGIQIPKPITLALYSKHHGFFGSGKVFMDQVDKIVETMFNAVTIEGVTVSDYPADSQE